MNESVKKTVKDVIFDLGKQKHKGNGTLAKLMKNEWSDFHKSREGSLHDHQASIVEQIFSAIHDSGGRFLVPARKRGLLTKIGDDDAKQRLASLFNSCHPTEEADVCIGHGEAQEKHSGNREFLAQILQRVASYSCASAVDRSAIANEVMQWLDERGGRLSKPSEFPGFLYHLHATEGIQTVTEALKRGCQINEGDALIGEDKETQELEGTKIFAAEVEVRLEAPNKAKAAREVLSRVKLSGGRFLSQGCIPGLYNAMDDSEAMREIEYLLKSCQKLRAPDVLTGRGHGANDRGGNTYFREQVESRRDRYYYSENKQPIVLEVKASIEARNGAFLKPAAYPGLFVKMTDREARTKISQRFREGRRPQKDQPSPAETSALDTESVTQMESLPPKPSNETSSPELSSVTLVQKRSHESAECDEETPRSTKMKTTRQTDKVFSTHVASQSKTTATETSASSATWPPFYDTNDPDPDFLPKRLDGCMPFDDFLNYKDLRADVSCNTPCNISQTDNLGAALVLDSHSEDGITPLGPATMDTSVGENSYLDWASLDSLGLLDWTEDPLAQPPSEPTMLIRIQKIEEQNVQGQVHSVLSVPDQLELGDTLSGAMQKMWTESSRTNGGRLPIRLPGPPPEGNEWILKAVNTVDDTIVGTFTQEEMREVSVGDLIETYGANKSVTFNISYTNSPSESEPALNDKMQQPCERPEVQVQRPQDNSPKEEKPSVMLELSSLRSEVKELKSQVETLFEILKENGIKDQQVAR